MPEVKVYAAPWESALALVAEHVRTRFGIPSADPLTLIAEFAYNESVDVDLRLSAAKELLKYTRPNVRAIDVNVNGQVDVNHTHRAEKAVEQVKALLASLAIRKYHSGQIEEGVLLTGPTEPVEDPTQH